MSAQNKKGGYGRWIAVVIVVMVVFAAVFEDSDPNYKAGKQKGKEAKASLLRTVAASGGGFSAGARLEDPALFDQLRFTMCPTGLSAEAREKWMQGFKAGY